MLIPGQGGGSKHNSIAVVYATASLYLRSIRSLRLPEPPQFFN
jgi:hypothetical protein